MKRKVVMLTLCLFFSLGTAVVSADEIKIEGQEALSMRFPDNIQHLGFPKGLVLAVAAVITPIGYPILPITEVTAKNLDTGLILKLTSVEIAQISGLYIGVPFPPFDPSKHLGVWEMRVKDRKNQYYFSLETLADTKCQIPEGKLKSEDLSDTYVIIICLCSDRDEKAYPVPTEFSSQTFRPLKEALGK